MNMKKRVGRLLGERANDLRRDVEEEDGGDEGEREDEHDEWVSTMSNEGTGISMTLQFR